MNIYFDQIESYLSGELSDHEKQAFEQALQSDAALAAAVSRHREMIQRLESARLRQTVKSAISEIQDQRTPLLTGAGFIWKAAAFVALLLAAFWFFSRSTGRQTPELADKTEKTLPPDTASSGAVGGDSIKEPVHTPETLPSGRMIALAKSHLFEPNLAAIRDAANPAQQQQDAVTKAVNRYNSGNFRDAANILQEENTVKDDDNARFLRANARFHLEQYTTAANDFHQLETSLQFGQEARWNYLLCQLATGNTDRTHKLLTVIIKDRNAPFRQKAMELESQLRKSGL